VAPVQLISELAERGINIRSLTEPEVDTTTPMGNAFYGIVAVFAQLRIDTIRENTMAGLAHARSQGRVGGRPTVMTPERIETALLLRDEKKNIQQIAKVLGVGRMSVSRALAKVDEGTS
jgi:DNA invertase Pin-like site-specific DNA recombinase